VDIPKRNKKTDKSSEFEGPILESPPATEVPVDPSSLFLEDTLAPTLVKFAVIESILKLLPKDYKFSDFVRELLIILMQAVKSEAGSILEIDQEKKVLFFRAVVGSSSDTVRKFLIPLGQGVVGHVAESRQPLAVSNPKESKLHLKSIEDAVGFRPRNLVALPIVVRGQVYGVLELLNRLGEEEYSAADIELLSYLCEMAARAIELRLMIAWNSETAESADDSSISEDDQGKAA